MARKIIVTDADRRRLGTLIDTIANLDPIQRRYIDDLEHELERAETVDQTQVHPDVITMNSTVRLCDLDTGEQFECTLVYPNDANSDKNRISVLAPIGTAIIGFRAGDTIEWPVPAGTVRLKVEEVLYQPELEGNFNQ